jgi:hypothetical protein
MKCFEREHLFAYAHRMLKAREADEVRAHLEACTVCQEVVTQYLRLDAVLDEWKSVSPSAEAFDARVRQAVRTQIEAQASSLWSGLLPRMWARWLAPAGLAVLVVAVALVTYRSHRISGPTPPESSGQRFSAARPPAQPPAETSRQAAREKKPGPPAETLKGKREAGPLVASRPALPVESQYDERARAAGEREATAQPSTSGAGGGALAWRGAEAEKAPRRVLQAPRVGGRIAGEAQPQAAPALAAGPGLAEAQSSSGLAAGARQTMATPAMALPAAKALHLERAQAALQAEAEEAISFCQNLPVLDDFDLLSDFDVLSELPQGGKKVDNRLLDLPPEEQERVLANDERFQRLPAERQERIRENLRRWNALSSAQKDLIRQRQEIFTSLSPAQRQQARAAFPAWQRLEPARRQAVLAAFRHLRSLPADQRLIYLSGPEVEQQFSPEERHVLASLSQLLPGSQLEPPSQPGEPQE